MKYQTSAAVLTLLGAASARKTWGALSLGKREVPQEHSHEKFLVGVNAALNAGLNPAGFGDAVFPLLGDAAAVKGAGTVTNLACLQQGVADQAFTNAKAANDIEGMTNALIYRALERNTGKVGLASAICTETAVNPEIDAITQHQDPASAGAAKINKDITLALAQQLNAIGADPQLALQSGTFEAGDVTDNTGAGNTCDTLDDAEGCIFTQNLLVEDATAAEIDAAVAGGGNAGKAAGNAGNAAGNAGKAAGNAGKAAGNAGNAAGNAADACDAATGNAAAGNATGAATGNTGAATGNAGAATGNAGKATGNAATGNAGKATGNAGATAGNAAGATGTNVQSFTGTLGGAAPPVISSNSDRPFSVNGATFLQQAAAVTRSCDIQKNACANAANSGALAGGAGQCETQQAACVAGSKAKRSSFRKRQAADTGSCGSAAVQFAAGLDGRKEASFQAVNNADFNHGSALNIKVISDFICGQLQSKCKADAATVATCKTASAAASQLKGQAAADSFNSAIGA